MNSLQEWWELLSAAEKVFWFLGVAGTFFLLLQTLLSFVGMDADMDMDGDLAGDISGDISADFSVFSFKSLVAFTTFFGWMGVVGLGRDWALPLVILAASGAGLVAMFLVAYMLFQFQKLETSGTMHIEEAISKEADVYLAIPAAGAGIGKVTLELNGNLRELQAVTRGDSIPTGSRVNVVDIFEENTLVVEPLKELAPPNEDNNQLK